MVCRILSHASVAQRIGALLTNETDRAIQARIQDAKCSGFFGTRMKRSIGNFGSIEYWEAQYKNKEKSNSAAVSEWFADSSQVVEPICEFLKRRGIVHDSTNRNSARIAHLGSGISCLGFELAQALPNAHIVNIDSSQSSLDILEQQAEQKQLYVRERVSYVVGDLRKPLLSAHASFDACVDKGTFDALEFAGPQAIEEYLETVSAMLVPGGWFLQISDRPPEARDSLLLSPQFGNAGFSVLQDASGNLQQHNNELFLYWLESNS